MIHAIGNSHCWVFIGAILYDNDPFKKENIELLKYFSYNFTYHHLGATLAYKFHDKHLPTVINNILPQINKEKDYVMLVAGEVDIRIHLPTQIIKQEKTPEIIVEDCLNRYWLAIEQIKYLGYKQIIWASHPSISTHPWPCIGDTCPVEGSPQLRNEITKLWNEGLKQRAKDRDIPFLSIYEDLVDEYNNTKEEYLLDYCHLNLKVLPLIYQKLSTLEIDYI